MQISALTVCIDHAPLLARMCSDRFDTSIHVQQDLLAIFAAGIGFAHRFAWICAVLGEEMRHDVTNAGVRHFTQAGFVEHAPEGEGGDNLIRWKVIDEAVAVPKRARH